MKHPAKRSGTTMRKAIRQKTITPTAETSTAAAAALATASTLALSVAIGLFAARPLLLLPAAFQIAVAPGAEPPVVTTVVHFDERTTEGSEANAVEITPDGRYIIVGWGKQPGHTDRDIRLIKTFGAGEAEKDGQPEWSRYYGDPRDDNGFAITVSRDRQGGAPNGYVIAGSTTSGAASDVNAFVRKTSLDGQLDVAWNLERPNAGVNPAVGSYGDTAHQETANAVQQVFDADGNAAGFIVAGKSVEPNSGNTTVLLFKLDTAGNLETAERGCFSPNPATFGIGGSTSNAATAAIVSSDATGLPTGFLIAGITAIGAGNLDVFLAKTTLCGMLDGAPQRFGGDQDDVAKAIRLTRDANGNSDGYLIAGRTASNAPGGSDALLIKTDLSGNRDASFPATLGAEGADFVQDIRLTLDGNGRPDGFILAGGSNSESLAPAGVAVQQTEYWLSRLDLAGQEVWHILKTDARYNALNGVIQNTAGAFVGVGQTQGWSQTGKPAAVLLITGPEAGHVKEEVLFHRGDATVDGRLNLTDAITVLRHLFMGGLPSPCPDAADSDDTGFLNIADPVNTLNFMFLGSDNAIKPPGPPNNPKGVDPTPDTLDPCVYPEEIP